MIPHLFHHCTLIFFVFTYFILFLFFSRQPHLIGLFCCFTTCISGHTTHISLHKLVESKLLGRKRAFFCTLFLFSTLLTYIYTRNSDSLFRAWLVGGGDHGGGRALAFYGCCKWSIFCYSCMLDMGRDFGRIRGGDNACVCIYELNINF
ncbi:hypothetical protein TRIATDRAFT_299088, partial [Trichoderma atroviride IMI 206040]